MFHYFQTTVLRSLRMFFALAKIMVPIMIGVRIAYETGVITWLGQGLTPVMSVLNLPPEAGIVLTTTALSTIYGGIAAISALGDSFILTHAQLSAMGAMMLIAHNLPVEQAIVRKAGASFWFTFALRTSVAFAYGALISWSCYYLDILQEPVSLSWLHGEARNHESSWLAWAHWIVGSLKSLFFTWLIILGLVLTLDIFERIGLTRLCTALLTPVLRFSGLEPRVAPVTTVGVLLGLSYGGALIIEATKRENYSPRTRFLALSWLSLCHSLIEDTLLILALGANLWFILVGRVLLTIGLIAILARLSRPGSRLFQLFFAHSMLAKTDSAA
ncbi:nucleoside recognition domain-containing protein [Alcaligenes endophyticus]|uniref:Nucleoside transporter/FeoB GTPase Gate domain-containing protein n=1 Tax=Alcaligenes endophyticus TaxID=1929088 RepID=A0ABT8EMN3_9BURK|nr:nucleoside recognition domain-containing protein [Alcaligenes endophyticus]MCX5590905.1 hypothetical protein [Alcaligenes endophyticus]MDN4122518.1 hypothetical protein [Alcaligenes endophyticus]